MYTVTSQLKKPITVTSIALYLATASFLTGVTTCFGLVLYYVVVEFREYLQGGLFWFSWNEPIAALSRVLFASIIVFTFALALIGFLTLMLLSLKYMYFLWLSVASLVKSAPQPEWASKTWKSEANRFAASRGMNVGSLARRSKRKSLDSLASMNIFSNETSVKPLFSGSDYSWFSVPATRYGNEAVLLRYKLPNRLPHLLVESGADVSWRHFLNTRNGSKVQIPIGADNYFHITCVTGCEQTALEVIQPDTLELAVFLSDQCDMEIRGDHVDFIWCAVWSDEAFDNRLESVKPLVEKISRISIRHKSSAASLVLKPDYPKLLQFGKSANTLLFAFIISFILAVMLLGNILVNLPSYDEPVIAVMQSLLVAPLSGWLLAYGAEVVIFTSLKLRRLWVSAVHAFMFEQAKRYYNLYYKSRKAWADRVA